MNGELRERAQQIQRLFSETWTHDTRDLVLPSTEVVLRNLVTASRPDLVPRLEHGVFGAGPLHGLLEDCSITEIVVNGENEIWYEREGQFARQQDHFLTASTYKNFVERVSAEAGVGVDLAKPFADGRWGKFRLHLACGPLTHCAFHLTLRRMPTHPWTLEKLTQVQWATPVQMAMLQSQIEARKNLLFIGPTGSGKTSVLGACLKTLPDNERVLVIEDTDELPRPNSASTKLLTRTQATPTLGEVNLCDLVKQSLRMRPQRVVMGEVRGAEAKDLLLALATGHSGSMGTLHAADPRQALLRLEMLVQMGAPQWNLQAIRQLLHLSVDTLVVCGNKNGHRRLEGIYKVAALESFGLLLEQLC